MARWAGEMEFEFVGETEGDGGFVASGKVVQFIRNHLARGEIEEAAKLYENATDDIGQALIDEVRSTSSRTRLGLAQMFLLARDFGSAAKIFHQEKRWLEAAEAFEKAEEYGRASDCFQMAGEIKRAAHALERSGHPARALELYEKAGPSEALAECYARQHRYPEAAIVYRRLDNARGEIEMLRQVPVAHPQRLPAVMRLMELLEMHGHIEQAIGLLLETVKRCEPARMHQPTYAHLARLLERSGRFDQAKQVRNRIQKLIMAQLPVEQRPQLQEAGTNAGFDPVTVEGIPVASAQAPVEVLGAESEFNEATVINADISSLSKQKSKSDPFEGLVDPYDPNAASKDAYSHLKSIPIFAELSLGDMRDLYRSTRDLTFEKGTTVIEQGRRGEGLFVVIEGKVGVFHVDEETGQKKQLAKLGAGCHVGDISLIDDAPTSARVVALSEVTVLFISRDRFHEFLYGREVAAMRIYRLFTRTLAQRLRDTNKR